MTYFWIAVIAVVVFLLIRAVAKDGSDAAKTRQKHNYQGIYNNKTGGQSVFNPRMNRPGYPSAEDKLGKLIVDTENQAGSGDGYTGD